MDELKSVQDVDLALYTMCCWLNCCCMGNLLGFILCMYCRSRIKHFVGRDDLQHVKMWIKRFWLIMLISGVIWVLGALLGGVRVHFNIN